LPPGPGSRCPPAFRESSRGISGWSLPPRFPPAPLPRCVTCRERILSQQQFGEWIGLLLRESSASEESEWLCASALDSSGTHACPPPEIPDRGSPTQFSFLNSSRPQGLHPEESLLVTVSGGALWSPSAPTDSHRFAPGCD